jgi:alkylation response protein AidB-like acyl-CoA dehydrogenase
MRINMIFEGSSEIMRLFIAREAVDPHLSRAGAMVDPNAGTGDKLKGVVSLSGHFAAWYPQLVAGWGRWPRFSDYGRNAAHMRFVERAARKLGRTLFYAMARFGPKLEKRQAVLFRLVDVGAQLFAMSAACVRAKQLVQQNPADRSPELLADLFCRHARKKVQRLFTDVFKNHDTTTYRIAQDVLAGKYKWLENGIIDAPE